RALRARARALRRRHHRGADDDHRVGERILALQPGVSHSIARVLEAMTIIVTVWSKGGCGYGRESGRGRQGNPASTGVDPREWAQPHGAGGGGQGVPHVRDPTRDLFLTVPNSAGKHTFFRCCLVVADHNSYHIGELAIGRKVAGLWPKGRKD